MRNADDANGGAIPQFCPIKFGNGNVETRAQLVFQAAHDLAAIFERLRCFDVEFEREESDGHEAGRWSLVVGKTRRLTTNDGLLCHYFSRHARRRERLDDVADFDIAVIGDGDATLHAAGDFLSVVLETAQRTDFPLEDDDVVAQ